MKHLKDQRGVALVFELVLVAVVLAVTGLAVYMAMHHKTSSSTASKIPPIPSKSALPSTAPTPNPYAGWVNAELKYEKLSYKYPPNWTVKDSSKPYGANNSVVTPGSDNVVLMSPDGLSIQIYTGRITTGSVYGPTIASQTVTTLNGSYYLDFMATGNGGPTAADISRACISTSASNIASSPHSKNIRSVGGTNEIPLNSVCIAYAADTAGNVPAKPINTFKNGPSFETAKLIVESLKY